MKKYLLFIFLVMMQYVSVAQGNHRDSALIPKAQVNHTSPGNSVTARIRCSATITSGNEPLYVIDGIPYEPKLLKDINPNDIESIEILKSPAANAIFGCRSWNGVIIITTKKTYEKTFAIKDAKERIGISYATITATHHKTGKSFSFSANETGTVQTDMLRTREYDLTISSIGYKTKRVSLKEVAASRYEILLEKEISELKEVVITGYGNTIRCSRTIGCGYETLLVCKISGTSLFAENISDKKKDFPKPSFKIYPNPVSSSGTVNLSFVNLAAGTYQIRMVNSMGQLFYSFQKQITGKNEAEQIHLNKLMVAGIYFVQVTDEKQKLVQSAKLIVQ